MINPPRTIRYCIECEGMTVFKYDPTIGHSCCKRCGHRFGVQLETYFQVAELLLIQIKKEIDPKTVRIKVSELDSIFKKVKDRDMTILKNMEGG